MQSNKTDGRLRKNIHIGDEVDIVQKQDQRSRRTHRRHCKTHSD